MAGIHRGTLGEDLTWTDQRANQNGSVAKDVLNFRAYRKWSLEDIELSRTFMLQSRPSTQPGVALTIPNVHPTELTVSAFWRRISDLSSRTKDKNGRWIGSPEVFEWNVRNSKPCERCLIGSRWKQCIVDEDHPSCRSCRTAKVSCDRKLRFLYEATSSDFFSSWDLFLHVYNTRRGKEVRAFQKDANKRRNRESVEYAAVASPSEILAAATREALRVALEQICELRKQLEVVRGAH
ncbi:hypothetical protein DFH06DRAFT_1119965 [Mycena polygramma]|nr:hypothetical protein DFH06DRAFT_1119965 [Mycena polygramma]